MVVGFVKSWKHGVPRATEGVVHKHAVAGTVAVKLEGHVDLSPNGRGMLRIARRGIFCTNGDVAVVGSLEAVVTALG